MRKIHVDTLVVGAGIAGSTTAKYLLDGGQSVFLASARDLDVSNSSWAQGGIVYEDKDPASLTKDIQYASQQSSNHDAVDFIVKNGAKAVEDLLIKNLKVPFDKEDDGELSFTKEAAHSKNRIIHISDFTGKGIVEKLHEDLHTKDKLQFRGNVCAIDLITLAHHSLNSQHQYQPSRVMGAYFLDVSKKEIFAVIADRTVLATGGVGQVYSRTTNAPGSFGHGISMAYRIGARVMNLEYVQFHPTVFYKKHTPTFLVSEAVRGEGCELVNEQGQTFMHKYHKDGSLAPRDILSRSIQTEMLEHDQSCVYLDGTSLKDGYFEKRFPFIYKSLMEQGVNPQKDYIPVSPGAHFLCGGIFTNLEGQTSIDGLYAVGEVACTGLHGANRLASTSLLEGATFGIEASKSILKDKSLEKIKEFDIPDWVSPDSEPDVKLILHDLAMVQNTMWNYTGLIRSERKLQRARSLIRELKSEVDDFYGDCRVTRDLLDLRNAVQAALLIINAASRNKSSMGCHFRSD